MKIAEQATRKIVIDGDGVTDAITLYVDDYRPGVGSIVIRCFNKAWTAGWGGMGKDCSVLEFFASCDEHYLLKNLVSHGQRFETNVAETIAELKRRLIDCRRNGHYSKEEVRKVWDDHIDWLDDGMQEFELFSAMSDMDFDLIEGATRNRLTSDAIWLRDTIIPTIQKAIAQMSQKESA